MDDKNNSLADNPYVQELFEILKENDKDTTGLTALLSSIKNMEDLIQSAESQILDMKNQINEIKEIQNHPIKLVLNNTSKTLETNLKSIQPQLNKIRLAIIEMCKNTVIAVKENGAISLDKLVGVSHVKQVLKAIETGTTKAMANCDKAVAKIQSFSSEYHATGRHVKNMVRMTVGKEPINTPKQMGSLAKSMCIPYQKQKKCLINICNSAIKAIVKLDTLGKNADEIKKEREIGKKTNVADRIADLNEKTKQSETQKPSNVIGINTKRKSQEAVL